MHVYICKFMQMVPVCVGACMCMYMYACKCMYARTYARMHVCVCIYIQENILTARVSICVCCVSSLNFPLKMSQTYTNVTNSSQKIPENLYVSDVSLCLLGQCFGAVRPKLSGLGSRGGIAGALSHERAGLD